MKLKILTEYRSHLKETTEQSRLIKMCNQYSIVDKRLKLIFAIPNESYGGGMKNMIRGAKLKREGRKPGVPDLFLPVKTSKSNGLFIEMKTRYNKPSNDQLEWLEELSRQNFDQIVAYSCKDAWNYICDYLGLDSKLKFYKTS